MSKIFKIMQIRLRTMMLFVALTGFLLGGTVQALRLKRLSDDYRRRALLFARLEAIDAQIESIFKRGRSESDLFRSLFGEEFLRREERAASMRAYNARMKAKYQNAARHPWVPLPPDPPEPPDP